MKAKSVTLLNTGMNRDLSQSKVSNNCVWENHNIRIVANDTATLLSVTNERGTKGIEYSNDIEVAGAVLGWNVLDNHIVLFTHEEAGENRIDRIYRCDYSEENNQITATLLFSGYLDFRDEYPIESIVHYESESVQKIYWVDGYNVLRFMNFMAPKRTVISGGQTVQRYPWQADNGTYDETYFDSNRAVVFSASASIEKDWSGNNRQNGTVQYILTYYNKYGQESGPAWCSDIVYLSPMDNGGEADGTNSTCVRLSFNDLDTRFDHFKVYSIFRGTLNGQINSNIIADMEMPSSGTAYVVDDNSHYTAVDTTQILYLGSKNLYPYTIAQKDKTLFIGNFDSPDNRDYSGILAEIKNNYIAASTGLSNGKITFTTSGIADIDTLTNIPYVEEEGLYSYNNQLKYTSSKITTFKSGEKYRFALKVGFDDGSSPVLFWIGDAVNNQHPSINTTTHSISRPVVKCAITHQLYEALTNVGAKTIQLMMAEATYSDRKILAQGIVNPTVFNVWERYNDRLYAMPSWVTRPRRAGVTSRHFAALKKSDNDNCEAQCIYPLDDSFMHVYPKDEDVQIEQISYNAGGIFMPIVSISCDGFYYRGVVFVVQAVIISGSSGPGAAIYAWDFKDQDTGKDVSPYLDSYIDKSNNPQFEVYFKHQNIGDVSVFVGESRYKQELYDKYTQIMGKFSINPVSKSTFDSWVAYINIIDSPTRYFNAKHPTTQSVSFQQAATFEGSPSIDNWYVDPASTSSVREISSTDHVNQAKFRKNLMFVDEGVVTLNSPEIEFESVHPDSADYGFRIVGIAEASSMITDYTVDASMGKLSGRNLYERDFSTNANTINYYPVTAWALWTEKSLAEKDTQGTYEEVHNRLSDYYVWGNDSVRYWLYMWNHSGVISGYYPTTDYSSTSSDEGVHVSVDDNSDRYSYLRHKVFANLTFCFDTKYGGSTWDCPNPKSLRIFNQTSSRTTTIKVGNSTKYYDGVIDLALTMPESFKYPIYYASVASSMDAYLPEALSYLYSNEPVYIKYATRPHAVISLGGETQSSIFNQTILPLIQGSSSNDQPDFSGNKATVWSLPDNAAQYGYTQTTYSSVSATKPYLFIGEIYKKITDGSAGDTRYGGITESAARNCRYIPAGSQINMDDIETQSSTPDYIYGDRGDTYFQRWDCLRTVPLSTYDDNSVIDIVSVMLETHINLDGRTDKYRGTKKIASIDTAQFGQINPVYSQPDNFLVKRIDEQEYRNDDYRTHVSWTMEKHDMADVDEWSHITLANSLPLDASRGACRALRSFRNSIVSFQDKGISEILFNPRVQVAASDGVPIELANSGKVEGKRYITTDYGCLNKWSIAPGKKALYFVDSLNKAFCSFNGSQIENISLKLGFSTWFKNHNSLIPWDIVRTDDNSIISFYDKINSDVYLVRGDDSDHMGTLVYNENLNTFTSFFDYNDINLMANVSDKFVSFKLRQFWQHNAGFFCNLHGEQEDFWTQYRVAPNPDMDKIWTNIEYRADFYRILDNNGDRLESVTDEILDGGEHFNNNTTVSGVYQPNETFSSLKVWNEYQQTAPDVTPVNPVKRFRIWRYIIPRAVPNTSNKYGFDRIRNPWINVLFKKTYTVTQGQVPAEAKDLMQLHDVEVQYYE